MRVVILTSVARTLDAFFGPWVDTWHSLGVTVVTMSHGTPSTVHTDHLEIPSLTQSPGYSTVKALAALSSALDTIAPDIVVTSTATASAAVRLLPRHRPIIYFCHGLHWASPPQTIRSVPFRVVESLLLRRTAAVVTLNRDDEDWFRRRLPANRVLYLPSGVGLDMAQWRTTRNPIPGKVVLVGDLTDRKDPLAAIRIFAQLAQIQPDATLHILGQGDQRLAMERLAAHLGCHGRVTFYGQTAVLPHLRTASVLVHTAHWEGLPRALLEATAIGLPVVAYDAKGTRDVPGAHLIARGDSQAAAIALKEAILKPIALIANSRNLDFKPAADRVLQLMQRLTA